MVFFDWAWTGATTVPRAQITLAEDERAAVAPQAITRDEFNEDFIPPPEMELESPPLSPLKIRSARPPTSPALPPVVPAPLPGFPLALPTVPEQEIEASVPPAQPAGSTVAEGMPSVQVPSSPSPLLAPRAKLSERYGPLPFEPTPPAVQAAPSEFEMPPPAPRVPKKRKTARPSSILPGGQFYDEQTTLPPTTIKALLSDPTPLICQRPIPVCARPPLHASNPLVMQAKPPKVLTQDQLLHDCVLPLEPMALRETWHSVCYDAPRLPMDFFLKLRSHGLPPPIQRALIPKRFAYLSPEAFRAPKVDEGRKHERGLACNVARLHVG